MLIVLSPLRQKYIESLLVLLKMQYLSMKTACRARCLWLCWLCLQVLSLDGCASATWRKKSVFQSSNHSVDSSSGSESLGSLAPTAVPIGPDEAAKFPHLASFRGNLLLVREGLQVVVSGEQNSWTPVSVTGLVPLVVAVFEAQGIGSKRGYVRSPALDGVMLRIECSKQCAPGFSVRLEGLDEIASETSPDAGVSGISLNLVSAEEKNSIAQIRIQVGGDGPGILLEALPTAQAKARLYLETVTGAGGNLLAVPEANLVEGGDSKRLSYVQVEASGGQFLLLPAPSSSVTVNGKAARIEASKIASKEASKVASGAPVRGWLFVGDKAVQNGFRAALEQELGAPFGVQELTFDGSIADAGSMMMADSWLANDSGDPLLLLNLGRKPVLRLPVEASAKETCATETCVNETSSGEETPLPFVLRVAGLQAGEDAQKVAGKLLKVVSEPLEQVSFYGQPQAEATTPEQITQMPDMVAVSPLGSQGEQRRFFMRVVAGEGANVVGAGIVRAQQWPIRMQLPQGVYEALFFKRSRGMMCRVPFDVSRRRDPGNIPPVTCGVGQRVAQRGRLPSFAGVSITPADENSFASVRNQRLGVDFGVSPAGDNVAVSILKDLGKIDLEDAEISRRVVPAGKRVILLPCPIDSGVIESLRQTPLASNDTTFVLPVRRCSPNLQNDSWDRIEQMKAFGLNGIATAPRATTIPVGGVGAAEFDPIDAVFPLESIVAAKDLTKVLSKVLSKDPAKEVAVGLGAPVLGRAGTYISVEPIRRLDANRVELTVKIGRAGNISRYQDLPWTLRSLRVLSRGSVLSEVRIDPGNKEYKMAFQMNAKNPMPVRVDLLGRFQGILSSTFHAPDDFIVAETQLLEIK